MGKKKIEMPKFGRIGTLYYEDDDGTEGLVIESEYKGTLLHIKKVPQDTKWKNYR